MLVKCIECPEKISSTAITCPHCGYAYGDYPHEGSDEGITYKKKNGQMARYIRMSRMESEKAWKERSKKVQEGGEESRVVPLPTAQALQR